MQTLQEVETNVSGSSLKNSLKHSDQNDFAGYDRVCRLTFMKTVKRCYECICETIIFKTDKNNNFRPKSIYDLL